MTLDARVEAPIAVALLTGGGDRPYAVGLAGSLASEEVELDFIGSDFLDVPEVRQNQRIRFRNLRGNVSPDAPFWHKFVRIIRYYIRLLTYTLRAKPAIFHVLWNNKFDFIDRVLLMLYYRAWGKKLVLTVHNVNMAERDGHDSSFNRLTLRIQYRLAHHLFVHTELMRKQLEENYGVRSDRVTIIPLPVNNTVPNTSITRIEARQRLGLGSSEKTILFFGSITPYKGLEYLVAAMADIVRIDQTYRLIIAGRPKNAKEYWCYIKNLIEILGLNKFVLKYIEFIADKEIEIFFKAADLLVLPYTHVFQSGVLFLSYNFGTPVIASDVGALRDYIFENRTGLICRPGDPTDLAIKIRTFFASSLYDDLHLARSDIRLFANKRYSWTEVGNQTKKTYESLLGGQENSS